MSYRSILGDGYSTTVSDDDPRLTNLSPPFEQQVRAKGREILVEDELARRRWVVSAISRFQMNLITYPFLQETKACIRQWRCGESSSWSGGCCEEAKSWRTGQMGRWVYNSFDTRWGHGQYPSGTCLAGILTSACAQVATRYQCPTSLPLFSLLVLNMLLTHFFILPRTTRWSYQRLERFLTEKGEEEKEEQSACVGIKSGAAILGKFQFYEGSIRSFPSCSVIIFLIVLITIVVNILHAGRDAPYAYNCFSLVFWRSNGHFNHHSSP